MHLYFITVFFFDKESCSVVLFLPVLGDFHKLFAFFFPFNVF